MSLTYKDAGVDIAAADAFVAGIAALAQSTHTDAVVPHENAYASLVRPPLQGLKDPLLAAACDGVGTKLLVAREVGSFEGLGQDLVAMQVNDLLPCGARPLLFLDYIATGKLDPEQLTAVVRGAARACKESGCILLGGETAEMPGVYRPGDFDLAGFAVGVVDRACVPDPDSVQPGDVALALPSSGVHANGFSLARKALLERGGLHLADTPAELTRPLGHELLEPTRLYVKPVLDLLAQHPIKAAAHITGGGLLGRGAKLMRPGRQLQLDPDRYERPAIFELIARAGDVDAGEMAHTFNMGLGFLIIVSPDVAGRVLSTNDAGWLEVGRVKDGPQGIDLGYAHS